MASAEWKLGETHLYLKQGNEKGGFATTVDSEMLSLNPHKDSMQQLYGYCSRSAIMAAAAAAAATQNTRQIMPDKPGRETALFQFSIYNGKK